MGQVSTFLDAVGDILVTRGWRQGARKAGDDRRCLMDAWLERHTLAAPLKGVDYIDARIFFAQAVGGQYQHSTGPSAHWNDIPGRTADEVIGACRKAAELARAAGK